MEGMLTWQLEEKIDDIMEELQCLGAHTDLPFEEEAFLDDLDKKKYRQLMKQHGLYEGLLEFDYSIN